MLGTKLKYLREQKKKTQQEMADALGISRAAYSHFETGRNEPSFDMVNKIADYFDVSIDFLYGRENVPEWASNQDVLDLEEMLNSNVNMAYGGENLTDAEKQRVKDILTGIFWEKLEKRKKM